MQEKKVVVIGGGTGTDIILSGLKRYTSQLTALVSTFDASSRSQHPNDKGGMRDSSKDDMRNSLLALGADASTTQLMRSIFAYQIVHTAEHHIRTLGNLFLSALTEITGSTDLALQAAAQVLNVQGRVLPMTLNPCPLVAHLKDGSQVYVESPSDLIAASAGAGLSNVRLSHRSPALGASLQAIKQAEVVILGPSDLYFNLLAPLQLEGVTEALAASKAVKIFVCNILSQPNTTDGWPASRFMRVMLEHMGGPGSLDYVILNSTSLALNALTIKAAQGYFPVHLDLEECLSMGLNVIVRPVASRETLHHDADKLVRTILFIAGWRSARRPEKHGLISPDRFEEAEVLNSFASS